MLKAPMLYHLLHKTVPTKNSIQTVDIELMEFD
jgi:hypothetical protein